MKLEITVDTAGLDPDEVLVEVVRQTYAAFGWAPIAAVDVERLKAMATVASR